jgi:hypothetical protein
MTPTLPRTGTGEWSQDDLSDFEAFLLLVKK